MEFERIVAVRNNKTVFRDGEDCIKLFKEDYPKDDILNEALNQARIERTSINVPKLKAITSFDGKWGIVSEFIEGKTIAELIKGHPGNSDEYIKALVKVQRTVNAETCPMLNRQREKLVKKAILSGIEEKKVKEILKSNNKHSRLRIRMSRRSRPRKCYFEGREHIGRRLYSGLGARNEGQSFIRRGAFVYKNLLRVRQRTCRDL